MLQHRKNLPEIDLENLICGVMSLRTERVRELLKREMGEIIRRECPVDEAGMITVNEVSITGDLQNASVFVSILGNKDQQARGLEMLQQKRKLLQGILGQSVVLKYTPHLKFILDDSIARGNKVLQILADLENSSSKSEKSS